MPRLSRMMFFAVIVIQLSAGLHAAAQEGRTLKIGAIFSVTGGATLLGEPEKKAVQAIVDKVNETGGVNQHQLEVLIEDNESDATKAPKSPKDQYVIITVVCATSPEHLAMRVS